MSYTELVALLRRWGQWTGKSTTRIAHEKLGYKSMFDFLIPCGGGASFEVDTEMLAVDRAMNWLRNQSPLDYRLLKLKYRYGYSSNRIADKLTKELPQYRKSKKKMHHTTAESYVNLAEMTILGHLEKTLKNACN